MDEANETEQSDEKRKMGGAVTKRVDSFITLQRLKEIRQMVQNGRPSTSIAEEKSAEWGVTERQVYNYLQKVMHEMQKADEKYVKMRKSQRRAQLERLYEKCDANGDFKTAANILVQLCKLDGVNSPESVTHDVKHRLAVMSDEDKLARLKELEGEKKEYIEATYTEVDEGEEYDVD